VDHNLVRYKFKPYFVAEREFGNLHDPIAIDSLLNGIPILGREYAFGLRAEIEESKERS